MQFKMNLMNSMATVVCICLVVNAAPRTGHETVSTNDAPTAENMTASTNDAIQKSPSRLRRASNLGHKLYEAAHNNQSSEVKRLLRSGAYINAQYFGGPTPLWIAVRRGNKDIVKILLDAGADPCLNGTGDSPIEAAKEKGYTTMFEGIHCTDTFPTHCWEGAKIPSHYAKEAVNTMFDLYSDRMVRSQKIFTRFKEAGKNPLAVLILPSSTMYSVRYQCDYGCVKYKGFYTLIFLKSS